jgi:hypothetical protein
VRYILAALLVMSAPVFAHAGAHAELDPGTMGAGSPLYFAERALDSAAVFIGLKDRSRVAEERAAEVRQAVENNRTSAASRALGAYRSASSGLSEEELEASRAVLGESLDGLPESAPDSLRRSLSRAARSGNSSTDPTV